MKPAERERIARMIRGPRSGFQLCGRMLLVTPIGRVLRGIFIEDSSDPHRVYLWAFVQPLFLPSTTVVLSLGQRLGGAAHTWAVADVEGAASALMEGGIQFFGPITSPAALAGWSLLEDRSDEYARETKAYALVAAGRYREGSQALHAFAASLPTAGPRWMSEMKRRAEELARDAETDCEAAQQRLREWESETRSALRLSEVP